jgi:DNA-binding response OmpR family regulator
MMGVGAARLLVLIVEDEPLIGMALEDAVEAMGHHVAGPVAELHEAWRLATGAPIACAILDINIRGGQSCPVAVALLDRGVPILLMTGYGVDSLPADLRRQPQLPKPFTVEQLDAALANLFASAFDCCQITPDAPDAARRDAMQSSAFVPLAI